MEEQDIVSLAAHFVNSTSSHIFLTGKAGTGKTTFLKNLALSTHKKFLIVAPTGIAALNAGGVTIHSQFQLPLGTFIPDRSPSGNFDSGNNVYTQYTLSRKHPISSARKQVLRSVDLLIIDEVSMLRSDVLDAIDYRMRSVRGNFSQSFGGAQLLMIGDLYQLPPIVKDHEWTYLKRYYHSAHFFEAKALLDDGFVFIELEKIFRQSDGVFIDVLNNLRNNIATDNDVKLLNTYYRTATDIAKEKEVITITTHNYRADEINSSALLQLKEKSYFFNAIIERDFQENIYPLPLKLELKIGAQIMFVKNDVSGENKYFNGKLATVVELNKEEITVEMSGTGNRYMLEKDTWENKKYTVNAKSRELDEEIVGTFTQYPIKLAWAITVHKSQGLTFEKAVIDVGNAFAPGQVYVALSRLRSLDGLILRTHIDPTTISSDQKVVEFSQRKNMQKRLEDLLNEKQQTYLLHLLASTFDFDTLVKEIEKIDKNNDSSSEFEDEQMQSALRRIIEAFSKERDNVSKFRQQLYYLHQTANYSALLERIEKGSSYYLSLLAKSVKDLLEHQSQVSKYTRQKTYLNELAEIDQLLTKKLGETEKSVIIAGAIIRGEEISGVKELDGKRLRERNLWMEEIKFKIVPESEVSKSKTGRVRKVNGNRASKGKGDSAAESVAMFKKGMTIAQIAEARSLVAGTVESHFTKAIADGKVSISEILPENEIEMITAAFTGEKDETLSVVYNRLGNKYSYGKLRAVQAHLQSSRLQTP